MGHCKLYWNVNYEELGTDVFIEGMIKNQNKQKPNKKSKENKQKTNKQTKKTEKKKNHQIERDCLRPMPY